MNVNKKLDRFKQWAGERMGSEIKTNVSDDFKALELEMGLRQEGKLDSHQPSLVADSRPQALTIPLQALIRCSAQRIRMSKQFQSDPRSKAKRKHYPLLIWVGQ